MKTAKTHRRSIPKKSKRIPKKQNNKKLNIPYILSQDQDVQDMKSELVFLRNTKYLNPVIKKHRFSIRKI